MRLPGALILRRSSGAGGDPGMPASGLAAMWDARDLSALSDGAAVSSWAPRAGSLGALVGSGTARPTYRATGSPSGGPAVEFDGADDFLSLASPAGLPTGAAAGTVVAIVSRCVSGGGMAHVVHLGAASAAAARGIAAMPAVWRLHDWDSTLDGPSEAPRAPFGVVLGHAYDGTARRLWVDGIPVASDAPTLNTGADVLVVGRNLNGGFGGEHGAFRVMALGIYSVALSDAQWAQTMAHARAAHGVR